MKVRSNSTTGTPHNGGMEKFIPDPGEFKDVPMYLAQVQEYITEGSKSYKKFSDVDGDDNAGQIVGRILSKDSSKSELQLQIFSYLNEIVCEPPVPGELVILVEIDGGIF